MICSKVLTLGKADLIARLAQKPSSPLCGDHTEYFNVGYPIDDPPRLRGSMMAIFSPEFLRMNLESIIFGSPVDTGGIAFGFFEIDDDPEKIIEECKCDGQKFMALLAALSASVGPEAIQNLYRHQLSNEVLDVLKVFFSSAVIDLIERNRTNPHSLLFEFSLVTTYALTEDYIHKLFVPNTLDPRHTFPKLHSVAPQKIVGYNPKYGIEHAMGQ